MKYQRARLYFMLAFRNARLPNPVLVAVFDLLKARGFHVDIGIAEEMVLRPEELSVRHDLYILKSHTDLWLSLAGVMHQQGARLLNPYLPCVAAQNKIMTARRLHAAGVPIPRSWVTGNLNLLNGVVTSQMSLVMKPFDGRRGNGIHIVHRAGDLATVPLPRRPVLVQEFVPGRAEELKVAVVGNQVFARRVHATNGRQPQRIPCPVTPEIRSIALRCGEVSGLSLYGLDMIEGVGGPVVIDLNYFPSYKGIPEAAPAIADHIEAYVDADFPRLAFTERQISEEAAAAS